MNLSQKNILILFLLSFLLTLICPLINAPLKLNFFAPIIVISFYQKSLNYSLWFSLLCGSIFDVFHQPDLLGLEILAFSLSTLLLYNQKQNFFSDYITTLPIMTFFYSSSNFLIECIIMYLIDKPSFFITFKFITSNLLFYPLLDGIYALLFLILPFKLFGKRQLRGSDYFIKT